MPARDILEALALPAFFNLGNGFKTVAERTKFGLDLLHAMDSGKFVGAVKESADGYVRFIVVADSREEARKEVWQDQAQQAIKFRMGFIMEPFTREDCHDFFPPVDEPGDPDWLE